MKKALPLSLSTILLLNSLNGMAFTTTESAPAGASQVASSGSANQDLADLPKNVQALLAADQSGLGATLGEIEKSINLLKAQKDSILAEKDIVLRYGMVIKLGLDASNMVLAQGGKFDPKVAKEKGLIVAASSVLSLSIDAYKKYKGGDYNSLTQVRIDMNKKIQEIQASLLTSTGQVPAEMVALSQTFGKISADLNKAQAIADSASNGDWVNILSNLAYVVNSLAHILTPEIAKVADETVAAAGKIVSKVKTVARGAGQGSKNVNVTRSAQLGGIADVLVKTSGYSDKDVQLVMENAQQQLDSAIIIYQMMAKSLKAQQTAK